VIVVSLTLATTDVGESGATARTADGRRVETSAATSAARRIRVPRKVPTTQPYFGATRTPYSAEEKKLLISVASEPGSAPTRWVQNARPSASGSRFSMPR
jgi:hypothetical protein